MNLPKFKNPQILAQAFIHRSYLNEKPHSGFSSNERLEFLGDAILAFVVSEYLYRKFPQANEGGLTAFRSAVVRTKSLAAFARQLNLGSFLKLSKGEEEGGGRENSSLLANTLEAFIGAFYLDQGIEPVKEFLEVNLMPLLSEIIKTKAYKDAKSQLQEIIQEKLRLSPRYKVLESRGPDHAKIFTVGVYVQNKIVGKGIGHSKQEAEESAAKTALEKRLSP